MQIGIIGSGYVGLCTGLGFCQMGHEVTLADIDQTKVNLINRGKSPIFEDSVDNLLAEFTSKHKLKATCDIKETVQENEVIFICVGTPCDDEGRIDLTFVKSVSSQIGKALKSCKSYPVLVVKCTVVPGTTESVVIPLMEKESGLKAGKDFGVAMNPEFLAEGRALKDFLNPSRIVIGITDQKSENILRSLYKEFNCPILAVNPRTAEMIKYASNAALATKISFINEIGNICKLLDIDTYKVSEGMGLDPRIGPNFLNAGIGFGGSCFPKDVKALVSKAKELGYATPVLDSVLQVNEDQPGKLVELVKSRLGPLAGKKVGVLGLAFKAGTDDIRESPSIKIIQKLLSQKADIMAYDPVAEANARMLLGTNIAFADEAEEVIAFAEVVLILTDWGNLKNAALYKGKTVIEGRRVLNPSEAKGFSFEGICW